MSVPAVIFFLQAFASTTSSMASGVVFPTSSSSSSLCGGQNCHNNKSTKGCKWWYKDTDNCEVDCRFAKFPSEMIKIVSKVGSDMTKYKGMLKIPLGYCLTASEGNRTAAIAPCPYDTSKGHKLHCPQHLIFNTTTAHEQNIFMCSHLNRQGNFCQSCNESYGQSVFTLDLACYSCDVHYSGWALYFFFEIFFLVLFLAAILVFQISPLKGNTKSFVMFCQLNTVFLSLGTEPALKYFFGVHSGVYIKIVKVFYGIWNLDIFRSVMPAFCVSPNLNNLDVMMLQYITIILPTITIILAWLVVDLHERGFRPVVTVWRPFRRCLSHYSVTNDPKRSIVTFLATFVTLSSTKVIFIALTVTSVYYSQDCCSNNTKVLYLQPDIPIYGSRNAPYIFSSILMVSFYVFLPVLLLILYSFQPLQDQLNKICLRSHNIQMFAEAFYTPYKDGSDDGQWDTRLFSTVYFFFRMLVLICFTKVPTLFEFMSIAIIHGFVLGLLCFIRPYKSTAHTFLDGFFFFIFLVAYVLATAISFDSHTCNRSSFNVFLHAGYYLLLGVPLAFSFLQMVRWLVQVLRIVNFKSILNRRRRGYMEIGPYEAEDSIVVDQSGSKMRHNQGRRIRWEGVSQTE